MVFQGCSDVVASRVEHLFSMPKAAGMQLLFRIRNSPGALILWGTRGLLTTTRLSEPPPYRRGGRLVNRSTQQSETDNWSKCRRARRRSNHHSRLRHVWDLANSVYGHNTSSIRRIGRGKKSRTFRVDGE